MKERLLAIFAVVLLVAVAVAARSALRDDGDGGGGPSTSANGRPVVACTPETVGICQALADAGEVAAETLVLDAGTPGAGDVAPDVWITWDPAPQIANAGAGSGPQPWGTSLALGTSPAAVLAEPALLDQLSSACTELDWACLAATAGDAVPIGVGDPGTAEGLARLSPLAQSLTTDLDRVELDGIQLRALVDSPITQADDAPTMARQLTRRQAQAAVVGPQGLLEREASSAQGSRLRVITPDPMAALTVVAVPRSEGDPAIDADDADRWCQAAADAIAALGLEPCADPPSMGDPDLAGFLFNVRAEAT